MNWAGNKLEAIAIVKALALCVPFLHVPENTWLPNVWTLFKSRPMNSALCQYNLDVTEACVTVVLSAFSRTDSSWQISLGWQKAPHLSWSLVSPGIMWGTSSLEKCKLGISDGMQPYLEYTVPCPSVTPKLQRFHLVWIKLQFFALIQSFSNSKHSFRLEFRLKNTLVSYLFRQYSQSLSSWLSGSKCVHINVGSIWLNIHIYM